MSVDPSPQGRTKDARTALARRRFWLAAFLLGLSACLLPGDLALARDRDRDRDRDRTPKATPAAAAAGMPTTLTKTIAVDAIIGSLAINRTPAAEKTLEQIVTGEIPFAGHSKQAAQTAIVQFALRGTPSADAFLVRILTEPDETIRPGDQGAYPAADLRTDTAHVLALVGSPNARLQLAKLYSQPSTSPAIRSAIEEMIRTPATPNFAAQFEVSRSPEAPEPLKQAVEKILVEKNASALKLALRLEVDPMAQAAGAAGSPFSASGGPASPPPNMPALLGKAMQMLGPGGGASPGGAMKTPGGGVTQNAAKLPPDFAKAMMALQKAKMGAGAKPGAAPSTPQLMMLELVSQLQNLQSIDPAMVARDLWKPEFVDEISKKLEDDKGNSALLVSALASLPTKAAREKLKHLLHKERTNGPEEFAKLGPMAAAGEVAKTPSPPATMRRRGRRKKEEEGSAEQEEKPRAMRFGAMGQLGQPKANRVVEFGKDWLDPGSLVILKMSVNYEDRPKEKLIFHRNYPTPAYKSPAMERRAKERAEKQKALESTYEWREAIEKAIRQWDERLSAVAESPSESGGTGENAASSDEKTKPASAKSAKAQAKDSSKTSKAEGAKTAAGAPAPVPSVAMPLSMHAGGTIAKEYHLRWPQDVTTTFGSDLPEPLVVDYVRLQGAGEYGKALTHYRGAIAAIQGAKPKIFRRTIESGTWLDAIQHDETGHRTRSIDVLVTHEPTEDENGKKSKEEALTIEILLVEIETPQSDVTPATHKKETRETTSTTAP